MEAGRWMNAGSGFHSLCVCLKLPIIKGLNSLTHISPGEAIELKRARSSVRSNKSFII